MTRIVSWNIRAGGGKRIELIAQQLSDWNADVVGLCEFRGTPASMWLQSELESLGLRYQSTTVDRANAPLNRLLIASKWPITPLNAPVITKFSQLWLPVHIESPEPFVFCMVHIPTYSFAGRGKYKFHDSILRVARNWHDGPAIISGDTNTGRIGIDEQNPVFSKESDSWMVSMEKNNWSDAFRYIYKDQRAYTWYSPNAGNGFRLDQAFINKDLLGRLVEIKYVWSEHPNTTRRDAVSDHAAILIDLLDA